MALTEARIKVKKWKKTLFCSPHPLFFIHTKQQPNKLSTSAFLFFNRKIPSAMDAVKKKSWNRKWKIKAFKFFLYTDPSNFLFISRNSQPFFIIYSTSYSSFNWTFFTEVLFIDTKKKILKLMVSLQKAKKYCVLVIDNYAVAVFAFAISLLQHQIQYPLSILIQKPPKEDLYTWCIFVDHIVLLLVI